MTESPKLGILGGGGGGGGGGVANWRILTKVDLILKGIASREPNKKSQKVVSVCKNGIKYRDIPKHLKKYNPAGAKVDNHMV